MKLVFVEFQMYFVEKKMYNFLFFAFSYIILRLNTHAHMVYARR
jgi:hypothetical protein